MTGGVVKKNDCSGSVRSVDGGRAGRLRSRGALLFRQHGVIAFCCLTFIALAGYGISRPGLYYDEVLFVNAVVGGAGDLFVFLRLADIPVMLMPYIGALKSWLYYPVFNIFGVSVYSIRWPLVLIGALTLWCNYAFVKKAFSAEAAWIFALLAAFEPSTLYHTRLDWGPTALMMLLRGILLLSAVAAGVYIYRFIGIGSEIVMADWSGRWFYLLNNLLKETLSGTSVYGFVVGHARDMGFRQLAALCLAAGIALGITILAAKKITQWRPLCFLGVFLAVLLIQIFFTRQATGPHHAAMIGPLWLMPIAFGLSQVGLLNGKMRWAAMGAVMAVILLVITSSLSIDLAYLRGFQKGVANPNWDESSRDLSRWLQEQGPRTVVCVDWGLGTVIHAYSGGRSQVHDHWPSFNSGLTDAAAKHFEDNLLPQRPLFVVRSQGRENFPQTRKNFLDMVRKRQWKLERLEVIPDRRGRPLHEIYEVTVDENR